MLYKQPTTMLNPGNVKSVIFSGDKTIILWDDGTKTIVTCGEGDSFDPYAGFCAAVTKKVFSTTSCVKRIIKQNSKKHPRQGQEDEYLRQGGLIYVSCNRCRRQRL